ncbi:MAG: hypothetical protein KJ749_02885 [Planctomycetes bacterium]|nr:hypothetical protein [Planctomycetota bacterium]
MLCKLHGSLNWFETDGSIKVEDRVVELPHSRIKNYYWPAVGNEKYHNPGGAAPLIVPPTYFKHRSTQALQDVWQTAYEALRECEKLVFIGYSFPDSDSHMPYFLASALADNVDLTKVTVIDPMASDIAHRIEQRFGPSITRILEPIKAKWQEYEHSI